MVVVRGIGRALLWALSVCCIVSACSHQANDEVEVRVSRVALDPGSQSPVVLLEDPTRSVALPIWVGPFEARAIAMHLEGIDSPRPMTHDLMKDVLSRVGVEFDRAVIGDLEENTYHAHLVLRWRGGEIEVDSRPSDAIALAVRFDQPIFVAAALLRGGNAIPLDMEAAAPVTFGGVTVQVLSVDLAELFELSAGRGVLVSDVASGPDLQRGDVILEVNGEGVLDPEDFRDKVQAGQRHADLLVQRDGLRVHLLFDAAGTD